ncbi:DUF3592 domain-containing protein [Nocardioides sp. NPDC127503]|uniref:DUF3592 domain-containing protein n=1 Tax=Nocardioides sp. NPDC127503 TaxID=3154516 RepID=UPI003327EE34
MTTMVIGWAFFLFGLVFAAFGISFVIFGVIQRQRLRTWTPATATIREFETRRVSSGQRGSRTKLIAHYEYRGPNGEEYAGEGALDNQRFAVDGPALPLAIVVDPLDPSRSMVASEGAPIGCLVAMAIPFTLFGGVFAMIGWALTGATVV